MATNYEQFAQQANTATERLGTPATSMFDFQTRKTEEDKYMSREEVKQALSQVSDKKSALDRLVQGGFTLEGYNDSTTAKKPQESDIMSGIGQGLQNVSAGIASGASQAVGGTLGIVGDFLSAPFSEDVSLGGIFTGKNKGGLGQIFKDETARQQKSGAESFGADTESLGYKGGKFGTGLGLSIATPGGIMGLAGKGAGLGTKIGLGAGQGAIETGKFLGLSEGRLGTPTELGLGATVGGAIPLIAPIGRSAINTAKKYFGTPGEIQGIQSAIKPRQTVKNGVNLRPQETINKEILLTNGLIRESGVKPVNLETYKTAIKGEMEKIGSEINRLTGQDLSINLGPTASKIRGIANSKEVQLLDPGEGKKLLRMANDIEKKGKLSLSDAEALNQFINDTLKSTTTGASEAYKRGLQTLVGDIRDGLDSAISNIPGEFKDIKKAYGALRNVYGDTVAREIVYNRQNMGGLIDSIGAIEGAGNVVSGGLKILTGEFKSGGADIAKGLTQNAVGRFIKAKNDPNNIIKSIFSKEGSKGGLPDIKAKPKPAQLLLPGASGKPTSANVVNVKPIEIGQKGANPSDITARSKIVVPGTFKDAFKDLSFLRKVKSDGESMGLPRELVQAIKENKSVKSIRESIEKFGAKKKVQEIYNLTKSNKGFINPGAIAEDLGINKIKKLNTGKEITLIRGKGGKGNGSGEAIRGKGLYLTDNVDVAKHYGPTLEKFTVKNSDILDGKEIIKNSKQVINSLPQEMKRNIESSFEYSYNSLINTIEGNTGIDAEKIAEAINNTLKNKYKGVRFNIGLVNDSLSDKGLGNENAFILF